MMKYKIGDILIITKRKYGHRFHIGSKVKVIDITEPKGTHLGDYSVKNSYANWYVTEEEVRKE